MPIDVEEFEDAPEEALQAGGPTNADRIIAVLASNADQAFTPKELHERSDVPRGSVGVVLTRLAERGLVRHRGEYWAIAEDADDWGDGDDGGAGDEPGSRRGRDRGHRGHGGDRGHDHRRHGGRHGRDSHPGRGSRR